MSIPSANDVCFKAVEKKVPLQRYSTVYKEDIYITIVILRTIHFILYTVFLFVLYSIQHFYSRKSTLGWWKTIVAVSLEAILPLLQKSNIWFIFWLAVQMHVLLMNEVDDQFFWWVAAINRLVWKSDFRIKSSWSQTPHVTIISGY